MFRWPFVALPIRSTPARLTGHVNLQAATHPVATIVFVSMIRSRRGVAPSSRHHLRWSPWFDPRISDVGHYSDLLVDWIRLRQI